MSPLQQIVFAIIFVFSRVSSSQECVYKFPDSDSHSCIKVQSKATAAFQFSSLFPDNATFVYAIDDYDKDEVDEENQWSSYIDKPTSFERVAYWLEYSNINDTPAARAHTEFGVLFTNASGSIGGGDNGCDGVLTQECAANLLETLRWTMYLGVGVEVVAPLSLALPLIASYSNLSCPTDLFDDSLITNDIAIETNDTMSDGNAFLIPSGNSSYTYNYEVKPRTYEEQLAKVGVGIAARYPIPQYQGSVLTLPSSIDQIQLELVCAKHSSSDASATSSSTPTTTSTVSSPTKTGDAAHIMQSAWQPVFGVVLVAAFSQL